MVNKNSPTAKPPTMAGKHPEGNMTEVVVHHDRANQHWTHQHADWRAARPMPSGTEPAWAAALLRICKTQEAVGEVIYLLGPCEAQKIVDEAAELSLEEVRNRLQQACSQIKDRQAACRKRLLSVYKTKEALANAVRHVKAERLQLLHDRTVGLDDDIFLRMVERERADNLDDSLAGRSPAPPLTESRGPRTLLDVFQGPVSQRTSLCLLLLFAITVLRILNEILVYAIELMEEGHSWANITYFSVKLVFALLNILLTWVGYSFILILITKDS